MSRSDELVAHTPNERGEWHALRAHLQAVAKLARRFAVPLGAPEAGYLLGLWHDVGKYHPQFQYYLEQADALKGAGPRRGPDHKGAGSLLAFKHLGPAAMAIQGHHGGLQSLTAFRGWLQEREHDPAVADALRLAKERLNLEEPSGKVAFPAHLTTKPSMEFFIRLLFSALVDADFLDTEAHFQPDHSAARGSAVTIDTLWERFEAYHRTHPPLQPGSAVNQVRREVYAACLKAASNDAGMFRLTVPTGGGKTRSAMAFALQHARPNKQERIIVAVPFISITQQTVAVYREIFDQPGEALSPVLEHHSSSEWDDTEEDRPAELWKRLAAENWDAPIVVTTTVQLFESLFSNRVSACRKLHRLANSVIILDEVQALPANLLDTILDGLRQLTEHYHTTVVLSTATQPAFDGVAAFKGAAVHEIVLNYPKHFAALTRVVYELDPQRRVTWEEVAAIMRESPQCLAVVNTKAHALALLNALDDPAALHLSTLLCGAHRTKVLADVRERLKNGEPCRLVSTQVVEAGVDIDFPLVLRAMGPLVSIIQAAGRCNREGLLERGRVVVFTPAEDSMPGGAYRTATDETRALLASGELDPNDPATVARYYRRLYGTEAGPGTIATDPDGIQGKRGEVDYPEVARRFRMIEDDSLSVVVTRYPDSEPNQEVLRWLNELRQPQPAGARRVLQKLQPYLVPVYRSRVPELQRQGFLELLLDGALGEWLGEYDPVRGLTATDPEYFV